MPTTRQHRHALAELLDEIPAPWAHSYNEGSEIWEPDQYWRKSQHGFHEIQQYKGETEWKHSFYGHTEGERLFDRDSYPTPQAAMAEADDWLEERP